MSVTELELASLIDKQLLYENLILYCRAADRMDIDGVKATYWPDSVDDHGSYIGSGHGWADAIDEMRERVKACSHHVGNVFSEIIGHQAKRESMFLCVVLFDEPRTTFFHGGRYRDLCEKRNGEWKVLRRTCVWDWCDSRPTNADWSVTGVPVLSHWGARFPEDPIYQDWFSSPPVPRPQYQSS